jgi:hypothetical protein
MRRLALPFRGTCDPGPPAMMQNSALRRRTQSLCDWPAQLSALVRPRTPAPYDSFRSRDGEVGSSIWGPSTGHSISHGERRRAPAKPDKYLERLGGSEFLESRSPRRRRSAGITRSRHPGQAERSRTAEELVARQPPHQPRYARFPPTRCGCDCQDPLSETGRWRARWRSSGTF